jgi:D-alanine transaminase
MKPLCYLDGRIQPLAEARLDPLDRGNLFGDALYEAIKILDGVILHLGPHLKRLARGLRRVEIPLPDSLPEICDGLARHSELSTGYLYIQVSRGVRSRILIPPRDLEPTLLVVPFEHRFDPPAASPKRAVTVPDWRWEFCDVKTTSLMATVLGKLRAGAQQANEVLFVGPGQSLREGGTTNVFVRRRDEWETHPTDGSILEGVTRRSLLDLLPAENMPVAERAPSLSAMETWQEAFICGTTTGVQPLVEVDGRQVGDGSPGPWTQRTADAFEAFERQLVAAAGAAREET